MVSCLIAAEMNEPDNKSVALNSTNEMVRHLSDNESNSNITPELNSMTDDLMTVPVSASSQQGDLDNDDIRSSKNETPNGIKEDESKKELSIFEVDQKQIEQSESNNVESKGGRTAKRRAARKIVNYNDIEGNSDISAYVSSEDAEFNSEESSSSFNNELDVEDIYEEVEESQKKKPGLIERKPAHKKHKIANSVRKPATQLTSMFTLGDMTANSIKLNSNFTNTPVPNINQLHLLDKREVNSFFDTFEGYMDQRKSLKLASASKRSTSQIPEISNEDFAMISNNVNKLYLQKQRNELLKLHKKLYPQFWFELMQGFSLMFYGVGSKREFLEKFIYEYLSQEAAYHAMEIEPTLKLKSAIPCLVVNGYNPTCNYREIFKDITKALCLDELMKGETRYWGNHVLLKIYKLIEYYKTQPPYLKLIILVHNIDGPSMRKDVVQIMLSNIARIRQIALIVSADHVYTPLLWDNVKFQNYNFIFHDITNYEPPQAEFTFHNVFKMGKNESGASSEGSKYVLQSLTSNSKKLYKLLVEIQVDKFESRADKSGKEVRSNQKSNQSIGVSFKTLLRMCSDRFIASNELSLRSMLTEFVEHKMAMLAKNKSGSETVWIPFTYLELRTLLDETLEDV